MFGESSVIGGKQPTFLEYINSQASIKRSPNGNVKSGLLKRWSLKKGLGI